MFAIEEKDVSVKTSEFTASIPDEAKDLFNLLVNRSYMKDLEILRNYIGFNQAIICYAYFLSADKKLLPDLEELSCLLGQYNIHFEFSQNFDTEPHFFEQLNNSREKAFLIVDKFLIQQPFDHLIWRKIEAGDVVPFITEHGIEDKLPSTLYAFTRIDGTSPCIYKKVWNIISYFYKNHAKFKTARSQFIHSTKIDGYKKLFTSPSRHDLIKNLIEKHKQTKTAELEELEKKLLIEIAELLQENAVENNSNINSIRNKKLKEKDTYQSLMDKIDLQNTSPIIELKRAEIDNWNLPNFNCSYVKRCELTNQIRDNLESDRSSALNSIALTVLHGLAGIGKTTLALHYCYLMRQNYRYIVWFNAEGLEADYRKFAIEFIQLNNINEKQTNEQLIGQVKKWLEQNSGWLIIYDNAQSYDHLEPYLPTKGGDVIVTSRNCNWLKDILVDKMTSEQAMELVKQVTKRNDNKISELVETLGYLPLAIAQAAAYIKGVEITVAQYLQMYRTDQQYLLDTAQLPMGNKHQSVYQTFKFNAEAVCKKSPRALELLNHMAWLAPINIPESLMRRCSGIELKESTFVQELGILKEYSLIKREPEKRTLTIHVVLQEVIRLYQVNKDNLEVQNKLRSRQIALLKELNSMYPDIEEEGETTEVLTRVIMLDRHIECLWCHVKNEVKAEKEWQVIEDDLQNKRAAAIWRLGNAERALGLAESILRKSDLRNQIVNLIENENQSHADKQFLNKSDNNNNNPKSSSLMEIIVEPSEMKVIARALYEVGIAHYELDHADERGLAYKKGSLAMYKRLNEDIKVALLLGSIGLSYRGLNKMDKALRYFEKSLKLYEKLVKEDRRDVAWILADIGACHTALGHAEKGLEFQGRSLKMYQNIHKTQELVFAESAWLLELMGDSYRSLGRVQDAIGQYTKSCELYKEHYSDNHPGLKRTEKKLTDVKLATSSNTSMVLIEHEPKYGLRQ